MTNLAPTRHSRFSPSASKRWLECAASLVLPAPAERESSIHAEEGTAAHEVAAWCALEGDWNTANWTLAEASNGVAVTDDMKGYVQSYLNNVLDYWTELSDGDDDAQLFVEAEVDYSRFVGLQEGEATGTSDMIIIAPKAGVISVHDLKYGRGIPVDAKGNTQLAIYALGATHTFAEQAADIYKVQRVIHQPRLASAPKEDTILLSDLLTFGERVQDQVAKINLLTEDKLTLGDYAPSDDACRFCPHEARCPARKVLVDDLFEDLTGQEVTDETRPEVVDKATKSVPTLDDEALDRLYPHLGLLRAFCDAVDKEVADRAHAGVPFSNAKLVLGRAGNRAWRDPEGIEALMKSFRLKKDEMYDFKLISPAKAEKLLSDNPRRWAKVEEQITRGEPKPILVPASDKRPAIEVAEFTDQTDINDLI